MMPEKCLHKAEEGKKKMYLKACLQQHRNFSPFFDSFDGLLGVEAMATLKRIASRLATKWRQPYSKTCGYVKSRVAITLVRATHCCLHGSRVPAHRISVQQLHWEDGAGAKPLSVRTPDNQTPIISPPPSNTNEQIQRHCPDTPIPEKNSLTEKKIREGKKVGRWQIRRKGDRVHLSLLEKDNIIASIKLIN